jgi:hypothetical protein
MDHPTRAIRHGRTTGARAATSQAMADLRLKCKLTGLGCFAKRYFTGSGAQDDRPRHAR